MQLVPVFKMRHHHSTQRGFTLVELITVILVLGIVAIVAVPKFASTDTYAEFALQQRMQTALRTLQIQSMYDTRPQFCYKLNFVSGSLAAFGPPTGNYQDGNQSASCANTIDFNTPRYLRSDSAELSEQGIDILALDSGIAMSFLEFNSLGQAASNVGTCAGGCEIRFVGTDISKVCVSAEGYVHEC